MYIAYAPPPPLSRPRQILFLGDAPLSRPTEKDTSTKRGCPLFFLGGSRPLHMGCVEALAAECLRCQFAPKAARFARAHQENSARARRGLLEKPSPSCLWHDTSPKGGGETRLCASFMAAHILGSPFGRAGTASAVTERASCQPHRPLPWLSPLRARPPRSLVSFWLTPTKVKGKVAPFLKKRRPKKL